MTDISMWDEQTEQIAAAHTASTQALAIAAVEPLWPYLSQAATRSEFDDRLALAGDNLTRMLTQTGLSATAAAGAAESLSERFDAHLATRTHAEAQQAASDRVAASLTANMDFARVKDEPNQTGKTSGFRDHLPEVLRPMPKGTFWPLVAEQPDYGLFGPKGDFTFAPGDRVLVHSTGGTWGDEPCPGTVVAVNGDQAVVTTDYSGEARYAAPVDHLTPLRDSAQVAASLHTARKAWYCPVDGTEFDNGSTDADHAPKCPKCGHVGASNVDPDEETSAVHALLQAEGYFSTRDAVDSMEGRKPRYQQGTETTTTPQRAPGKANPDVEKWRQHQESHPNEWTDSMEETRNRMRIDDNHADAASAFSASLASASDAEWAEAEGLLAEGGYFLHQQNQADPHATVLEGYRNQSEEAVDGPPRPRPTEPVQPKQADAYDQQRARERADEVSMNRAKDEYYAAHPNETRYQTLRGSEYGSEDGRPYRHSEDVNLVSGGPIVGSRRQAVNENAYGADRYLRTPTPPTPDWITDEWEDGKATQEELDQGRAAHEPTNPFADTLTTIRQVAAKHLASEPSSQEGLECRFCHKPVRHLYGEVVDEQNGSRCPANPAPWPKDLHSVYIESLDGKKQSARRTAVEQPAGEVSSQTAGENLHGEVPSSDFDTPPAQPRTTRPRVMPGGDQAASQPNLVTVDTQVLPGPQVDPMGDQMGAGGGFDMGYADAMSPSPDQLVAARIARIASRVLLDNPTLDAESARTLAAQTVATYPEMVSLPR